MTIQSKYVKDGTKVTCKAAGMLFNMGFSSHRGMFGYLTLQDEAVRFPEYTITYKGVKYNPVVFVAADDERVTLHSLTYGNVWDVPYETLMSTLGSRHIKPSLDPAYNPKPTSDDDKHITGVAFKVGDGSHIISVERLPREYYDRKVKIHLEIVEE